MKLTIILPISRINRIARMAEQVRGLRLRPSGLSEIAETNTINLLIVVDNPLISHETIRHHFGKVGLEYKAVFTGMRPIAEFDQRGRRRRIAEVFKFAAQCLPKATTHVIAVEDDGEFTPDSVMSLAESYLELSIRSDIRLGLVSGVEAGRWGIPMLGLWNVDNRQDPSSVFSLKLPDNAEPIQEIAAAGFYFFMVSAELFKATPFHSEDFGPDVHFGLDLVAKGFSNFVDWRIVIGHATNTEVILPTRDCRSVVFKKVMGRFRMI